jgi:hypothetical protein
MGKNETHTPTHTYMYNITHPCCARLQHIPYVRERLCQRHPMHFDGCDVLSNLRILFVVVVPPLGGRLLLVGVFVGGVHLCASVCVGE